VNQSILFAKRHPEVKSLVLLSGDTSRIGRQFLRNSPQLPIFAAAADDDENAVQVLQWIVGGSRNPGNRVQRYQAGGHGIEMFAPHPELAGLLINWLDTTLLKTPGRAPVNPDHDHASQADDALETIDEPGGAARIASLLAQARKSNPGASLFSETIVNLIGYEHLQDGDRKGAIEIFRLNAAAFPRSPNVYDSLSDAYVADSQTALAIENAEKVLQLLPSDAGDTEERRKLLRESAGRKLKQLRPEAH
jgi:tetratricopeptide (TPR) repeat protein